MIAFLAVIVSLAAMAAAVMVSVYAYFEKATSAFVIALALFFAGIGIGYGGLYYGPQYDVWQQGMAGTAELARAEQNRQIRAEEAKANYEAAKLNAQAEIERAKGAAEANKIMSDSLGGPDRYLRWRWITMLESNEKSGIQREIIYVPADGNMPMTEAGRAVQPSTR